MIFALRKAMFLVPQISKIHVQCGAKTLDPYHSVLKKAMCWLSENIKIIFRLGLSPPGPPSRTSSGPTWGPDGPFEPGKIGYFSWKKIPLIHLTMATLVQMHIYKLYMLAVQWLEFSVKMHTNSWCWLFKWLVYSKPFLTSYFSPNMVYFIVLQPYIA